MALNSETYAGPISTRRAQRPPHFNNPALVVQSWYVVARSSEVRPGQIRSFDRLNRRIALYRDAAGVARAIDARCPHLGADLGHGCVIDGAVQCAFHRWRWADDGSCADAPGLSPPPSRRARVYPTCERWGLIWLFNGARPGFKLPTIPDERRFRAVRLPTQTIRCHPHLVIGNGLDAAHFDALHDIVYSAPPQFEVVAPHQVTLRLQGRPRAPLLQRLTGSARRDVAASFTTIGGSLALATIHAPVRLHVLFSGRPTPGGQCETQTVLFLPRRGLRVLRSVALVFVLLRDDRRILDDLRFVPGFTERDAALKAFAELIDAMPTG